MSRCLLANDSDTEGDTLTVTAVDTSSAPAGTCTWNADGSFTHDPNGEFNDLDPGETATGTVVYTIGDGNGGTDTGTITITIHGVANGVELESVTVLVHGWSDGQSIGGPMMDMGEALYGYYSQQGTAGLFEYDPATGDVVLVTDGGSATAGLFDSTAYDKLQAEPPVAKIYSSQYSVRAKFFETVTAYATAGGTDNAQLLDSTANDKLISTPTKVRLYNTTDNWDITARLFESATVVASDGYDTARLFGGDLKDIFRGRPNKSTFYGPGYDLTARCFDTVTVYGNGGLYDAAKLHDTAGDDHLTTNATQATLARTNGTRTLYEANDFDTVHAYHSEGTDTHESTAATDYVLDLVGDWTPTPSQPLAANILPLADQNAESWLKRTYVAPK